MNCIKNKYGCETIFCKIYKELSYVFYVEIYCHWKKYFMDTGQTQNGT